ncbi:MAG TPA: VOC family protein, partial [Halioglobus sp.]
NIAGGKLQAVYLQRDGTRIELLYYPDAGHLAIDSPRPMNKVGLTHLSLRVTDLDAVVAAIAQGGGAILTDTRIENAAWGSKAIFVTDPDGLRIELLQSPGDPDALPGS